jgi:hypothetical protein
MTWTRISQAVRRKAPVNHAGVTESSLIQFGNPKDNMQPGLGITVMVGDDTVWRHMSPASHLFYFVFFYFSPGRSSRACRQNEGNLKATYMGKMRENAPTANTTI